MSAVVYKRILLKLSGEMLAGGRGSGIDPEAAAALVDSVASARELGVEVGLVIGGGNIFRGITSSSHGVQRATGDYMGMLATLINALALRDFLQGRGIAAKVLSSWPVGAVIEPYERNRACSALAAGEVVIFAGGTGNPFFTTDTAAALRALEIGADVVIKGTKVDYIYDQDPAKHSDAKPFKRMGYAEAISLNLRVMDQTAFSMCQDNKLPIVVYNAGKVGALRDLLIGKEVGTVVA